MSDLLGRTPKPLCTISGFLLLTDGAASFYYVFSRALTGFNAILIILGHRFPVTSGRIVSYTHLFDCFLSFSIQYPGGPRAVKVVRVTNFPFLHTGQIWCCSGLRSLSCTCPRFFCSWVIVIFLW